MPEIEHGTGFHCCVFSEVDESVDLTHYWVFPQYRNRGRHICKTTWHTMFQERWGQCWGRNTAFSPRDVPIYSTVSARQSAAHSGTRTGCKWVTRWTEQQFLSSKSLSQFPWWQWHSLMFYKTLKCKRSVFRGSMTFFHNSKSTKQHRHWWIALGLRSCRTYTPPTTS